MFVTSVLRRALMAELLSAAPPAEPAAGKKASGPGDGASGVDTTTFRVELAVPPPTEDADGNFFQQLSNRLFGVGTGGATIKQTTIAAPVPEEEDLEGHTATKIQAIYRGHASRKSGTPKSNTGIRFSTTVLEEGSQVRASSTGQAPRSILRNSTPPAQPKASMPNANRKQRRSVVGAALSSVGKVLKNGVDGIIDFADDAFGTGSADAPPVSAKTQEAILGPVASLDEDSVAKMHLMKDLKEESITRAKMAQLKTLKEDSVTRRQGS